MDWSLVPKGDQLQAIRIRRMLIASATSAVAVALIGVAAWLDYVPYSAAAHFASIVVILVAGFYACLRSGLNLRFSDPSLTVPMLVAAGLTLSLVAFEADEARGDLMLLYPVAFIFGVFRLTTRQLLGVALFLSVAFAVATGAALRFHAGAADLRYELFRVGFLTTILVCFAFIGGHISALRRKLRRSNEELKSAVNAINSLANRDALTGVANRWQLMELLQRECKRAERGGGLCVCMTDLDHFKSVNDTYGHAAGDEVLKSYCATVNGALRATDLIGRYGGEEFIVALSQTPKAQAGPVVERIRKLAAESTVGGLPEDKRITVSIGVAEHRPRDSIETTIARADAALYQAKSGGRNRVVFAD